MAVFGTKGLGGLGELRDPGLMIKPPENLSLQTDKGSEFNAQSHLEKLIKDAEAKRAKAGSGSDLAISRVDLGSGLLEAASLSKLPEDERLLRQAKEEIAKQQYSDAISTLERLLALDPNHHEGLYLKACGHFGLHTMEEMTTALRCLAPLRNARLESQLGTRVEALKKNLRDDMLLPVLLETKLLMLVDANRCIARQRELVQLDPEYFLYHVMLAITLTTSGRHTEALDAVLFGLQHTSSNDRGMLQELKNGIEKVALTEVLAPAIRFFKEGKYGDASSHLSTLDKGLQDLPICRIFKNHIEKSNGGLFGLFRRVKASGLSLTFSAKDVDAFHFILVKDEISEAKRCLTGSARAAISHLTAALRYAPEFPFAHFLMALAAFQDLTAQFQSSNKPDLEAAIKALKDAREHAKIGAKDEEINQAKDLLKAVESNLEQLEGFKPRIAQQQNDQKLLTPLVEAFNGCMTEFQNGNHLPSQLKKAHDTLLSLSRKIPVTRRKLRMKESQEVMNQLEQAVKNNLDPLREVVPKLKGVSDEEAIFRKHAAAFHEAVEAHKGGRYNYATFVAKRDLLRQDLDLGVIKKRKFRKQLEYALKWYQDNVGAAKSGTLSSEEFASLLERMKK